MQPLPELCMDTRGLGNADEKPYNVSQALLINTVEKIQIKESEELCPVRSL